MKKLRKLAAILVAGSLALTSLTGCGTAADKSGQENKSSKAFPDSI